MLVKDLIRARRLEKGYSLKELSLRVGVSEATISRWENGRLNSMRHGPMKLLAEALGVSPIELLPPFKSEAAPAPALDLTEKESLLIKRYRRLDPESQQTVDDIISVRLARLEQKALAKAT